MRFSGSQVKMENVVGIRVQIHPVALFTIVDSYERRQDASRRVIGTLLGVKERAGLVEIRSGYPVPHNETEEEVRGLSTKRQRVVLLCKCEAGVYVVWRDRPS